ncbi:MAG: molybdopterin-dependent oxidoreductase [Bacteroidetes bacterium]|nr:molybdopterin-dependent oxidoreductase [Bacteroidota bacterium]
MINLKQAIVPMKSPKRPRDFSSDRRAFIKWAPLAALAACNSSPGSLSEPVLQKFQSFNDWFQSKVFDPDKLAPEYSDDELTPLSGFRVNGNTADDLKIDPADWKLQADGLVQKPGTYSLEEIQVFPKKVMNTRHVCVEGWSMIPKWGGTVMADFLNSIGADVTAKYLNVECGDGYYCSYDMPSVWHKQTILCYEAYGKPLSLNHGAPLRIVIPTKLGYKQCKWVTKMTISNEKSGGYWEDQGYDWFAGI